MHRSTRQQSWYLCALAALLWLPSSFAQSPGESPQPPTASTSTPAATQTWIIDFKQGDAQEWADAINALMGLSDSDAPLRLEVTDEGRVLKLHGTEKSTDAVRAWIRTTRQLAIRKPQEPGKVSLATATAAENASPPNNASAAANTAGESPTVAAVTNENPDSVAHTVKSTMPQRQHLRIPRHRRDHASSYDPTEFDTTRVDLLVVSVSCPPDKHASFDAAALQAEATTPETFLAALKQLGDVRVLSAVSGPIDMSKTSRIATGTQMPFVRNRTTTKSGQLSTSVEYEDVGMIFELRGAWSDSHANIGRYNAEFEVSFATRLALPELTWTEAMPAFHEFKIDNAGEMASGKPIIFFAANTYTDQNSSPIAVCRLVLTKVPKPTE